MDMKNMRQDMYPIQAMEIQIYCTWITHQSQWAVDLADSAAVCEPSKYGDSKLHLHRFHIWQP